MSKVPAKSKLKILSLLSLILLAGCKTHYISNACLVFEDIRVSDSDKETLLENENLLSYEFLIDLKNYKDSRKEICKK